MIQISQWFYGEDLIIDLVSAFVLLLIALFSLRYYKVERKNKNYIYLAISFLLIAVSFFFKILANFTVYYKFFEVRNIGLLTLTFLHVKTSDILFIFGYLIYRLLHLLGLYILYLIYQKNQSKYNIFLMVFFIMISTYSSESAYYIFHLTALVLLSLITIQYYENYKKNKLFNSKMLTNSFAIIGLSQILFIFVQLNKEFYVAAEIIQLVGYLILLTTFVKVLWNAKKKE